MIYNSNKIEININNKITTIMATITNKALVEHIVATTNMLLGTKHLVKDVSKIEEDKVHNMYDVYVNDRLVASTNITTVKEFCHLQ